ncbi:MAG: glycosyltransferase family 2 protein [Bacteroidota bacterium]
MSVIEFVFWLSLGLVVFTYLGYGLVMRGLIQLQRMVKGKPRVTDPAEWPTVTFLVAAYNEEDFIVEKIHNTLDIDYPKEKVQIIFVTDGSSDQTPELVAQFPEIQLYHQPERRGKIAAVNRVMPHATHEITIYSDANAMLNREVAKRIVRHYQDAQVAAVAGEKRVWVKEKDAASAAGESLYWRYESTLRKWDAEWYSVMGAAGELFSIRTSQFESIPTDTLIEDFFLTMRMVEKGYTIAYEPEAYAMENASSDVKEELKRKIRISAGGLQAIWRLRRLFNPFKYPRVAFQFLGHRAIRWTLAPLSLLILFILHPILAIQQGGFMLALWGAHLTFYSMALIGWLMARQNVRMKALFVPYYFLMMNYAVFMGLNRLLKGTQTVLWERAKRKTYS